MITTHIFMGLGWDGGWCWDCGFGLGWVASLRRTPVDPLRAPVDPPQILDRFAFFVDFGTLRDFRNMKMGF